MPCRASRKIGQRLRCVPFSWKGTSPSRNGGGTAPLWGTGAFKGVLIRLFYQRWVKRWLDVLLSLAALLVLLLPLLLIAVLIPLDSPGPALFRQQRMGRNGKPFTIWKLRSMSVAAPHDVPTCELVDADHYMTRFQRLLRRTSIDELPQLWNILKGDMSIVGPRPVVLTERELLDLRRQNGADRVRPGLTGWAQIHGRDEVDIWEKAALDGEYVRRMSLLFDCRCVLATVGKVLHHEGVVEGCDLKLDAKQPVQSKRVCEERIPQ